jgi:hypothetical protein
MSVIDSMTVPSSWVTALWNVTPSSPSWTGFGQQFQGNGDKVTEVKWYGYKQLSSGGGTLVCKIYTSLADVQSGASLATSNEINYDDLPASAGWFSFTFPTPFQTVSGQKYFVVITGGVVFGSSYVNMYYSGAQRLGFQVLGREYGSWRVILDVNNGIALLCFKF